MPGCNIFGHSTKSFQSGIRTKPTPGYTTLEYLYIFVLLYFTQGEGGLLVTQKGFCAGTESESLTRQLQENLRDWFSRQHRGGR